jgi:clan AA aspartic protease
MGLTYVTVRLRPLAGSKSGLEESFLVDTGAIDCFVAGAKLRKAGIKPEGKDAYELADGTTVELPYGFARVTFMGSETVSKVAFGPSDAESILGVAALESTGIGVDPVTKTLKRMAAKPLKGGR